MICPKCKEEGRKSFITIGMGFTTCMFSQPFYDESGVYHSHDSNKHTKNYTCSNNHKITISSTGKCPNCSWGHDSEKVTVKDIGPQVLRIDSSKIAEGVTGTVLLSNSHEGNDD